MSNIRTELTNAYMELDHLREYLVKEQIQSGHFIDELSRTKVALTMENERLKRQIMENDMRNSRFQSSITIKDAEIAKSETELNECAKKDNIELDELKIDLKTKNNLIKQINSENRLLTEQIQILRKEVEGFSKEKAVHYETSEENKSLRKKLEMMSFDNRSSYSNNGGQGSSNNY